MVKVKKKFVVVAYDVSNSRKRTKIAKMLENYGERINLSVVECMLTQERFVKLREKMGKHIDLQTDKVVYYTICVDCFTKVIYYPDRVMDKPQTYTV